jgi:hypothetical protein
MNHSSALKVLKKTGLFSGHDFVDSNTDSSVMRLDGTNFYASGGPRFGGNNNFGIVWGRVYKEDAWVRFSPARVTLTFEEVFESVDDDMRIKLAFHLDLFNRSFEFKYDGDTSSPWRSK